MEREAADVRPGGVRDGGEAALLQGGRDALGEEKKTDYKKFVNNNKKKKISRLKKFLLQGGRDTLGGEENFFITQGGY